MRLALVAAAALALPAAAPAATVDAQFDAFGPSRVDVLPGETVRWQNVSERSHTVTAAEFDSGDLGPGVAFERVFTAPGVYPYGCVLHPSMAGEVGVARVLLDPLPLQAVPAGDAVAFAGRTADPAQPVRIERLVGDRWATVATTTPQPDGSWRVTAPAAASGEHRAASDAGVSRARPLLVSDRQVLVQRSARGLAVSVVPPLPYGRLALQRDLRDRFGWWTVRRVALDYRSRAFVPLRGQAAARVALLGEDGWTPLALSATVGRPRPTAPPAPHAPPGTS